MPESGIETPRNIDIIKLSMHSRGREAANFLAKNAKVGAYLDLKALNTYAVDYSQIRGVRIYATAALLDIQSKGKDSLYHLCLPTLVINILHRHVKHLGIGTISQLREKTGLLNNVVGLGRGYITDIKNALAELDRKLAEENLSEKSI